MTSKPHEHPIDFPTELWIHIVGLIRQVTSANANPADSYLQTLKSLSLTCKMLQAIVQPLLFKKVHLDGIDKVAHFVARKLDKMFETHEGSAGWVQELYLRWKSTGMNTRPTGDLPATVNLDEVVSRLVSKMDSLRRLYVDHVCVPQSMYSQLCRLSKLRSVSFRGVEINWRAGVEDLDVGSSAITDLMVLPDEMASFGAGQYSTPPPIIQLARSPRLQKLHLWRVTEREINQILARSSNGTNLPELTTLMIQNASCSFQSLMSLAPHCPNLLFLAISITPPVVPRGSPTTALPSIDQEIWPRLNHFGGSLQSARLLVPGRPVEKMMIKGGREEQAGWDRDAIMALTRGSVAVKELLLAQFTWAESLVEDVAALFPDLESLSISCRGDHEVGFYCCVLTMACS